MEKMKDIMGLIPTPLTDDGKVDEVSLRRLIDYEMENGCCGVGVLAAIGEGYLISDHDRRKVIEISANHMNGKGPLMVGCPALGTVRAIELCKEAENLGADAILAFNPLAFRVYKTEELIEHFNALSNAVNIQITPYARRDDPIPFDVLSALISNKKISYMKYAFTECEFLEKLSKRFEDEFFIFCGADTLTLRYLLLGCKGVLTATAAILPREHVQLLAMVKSGDLEAAREFYYETISPWNDIAFYDMRTWHYAHKVAFQKMGIINSATVMLPQAPSPNHQIEEVEWFVKHFGKKK